MKTRDLPRFTHAHLYRISLAISEIHAALDEKDWQFVALNAAEAAGEFLRLAALASRSSTSQIKRSKDTSPNES